MRFWIRWAADTRERSFEVLKPGGILISVVSPIPDQMVAKHKARAVFFIVEVTTGRLNHIAELFDSGRLLTQVGTVLHLDQARLAHEMLAGKPHPRGKIVLETVED
jgi:NADPH:quinone reductase-like Zn-dependent oxidoreductase